MLLQIMALLITGVGLSSILISIISLKTFLIETLIRRQPTLFGLRIYVCLHPIWICLSDACDGSVLYEYHMLQVSDSLSTEHVLKAIEKAKVIQNQPVVTHNDREFRSKILIED